MKKDNTKDVLRKQGNRISEGLTIGVDLGDRTSRYCVVDPSGEELWDGSVSTTGKGLQGVWGSLGRSRVVMEVGTHSPWVSRLLEEQGHEVIVANARQRESGERAPELRITEEGDRYLRMLLVQGAHYIIGPLGPDTDLRRWGLQLAGRGGKNAKKRAVVAVARKLAILLHHLWVSGEQYQPLRGQAAAAA